jgi:hypothetical protein
MSRENTKTRSTPLGLGFVRWCFNGENAECD